MTRLNSLGASIVIILGLGTIAQDGWGQSVSWTRQYRTNDIEVDDRVSTMALDVDGNVYVTGTAGWCCHQNWAKAGRYGSLGDFVTVKYDAEGNKVWDAVHTSPGQDVPSAIAVDEQGNVYVSGSLDVSSSWGSSSCRGYAIVKYNADGVQQWANELEFPLESGCAYPEGLVVDRFGNVYVTASERNSEIAPFATVKYGPDGSEQWVMRLPPGHLTYAISRVGASGVTYLLGGNEPGQLIAAAYDSSGSVLWVNVRGGFRTALTLDDHENLYATASGICANDGAGTIKIDPLGNEVWTTCHGRVGVTASEVDQAGYVYLLGLKRRDNAYEQVITKLGPAGEVHWETTSALGPAAALPTDLVVDSRGNVFVTGDFTAMYSPEGVEQWSARYDRENPVLSNEGFRAIGVDGEGDVVVSGGVTGEIEAWFPEPGTFATISYDSTGTEQWVSYYDSPPLSDCIASTITVDSQGDAIVAGTNDRETVTMKYSSNGDNLWVDRHDFGPGGELSVEELTVDPDDNVIVAGFAEANENTDEYFILKYNVDGSEQWLEHIESGEWNSLPPPLSVTLQPDGGIAVARSILTGGDESCVTALFDSSGVEQWSDILPPTRTCRPGKAAFDDSGNLWVVAVTCENADWECRLLVAKYTTSGEQLLLTETADRVRHYQLPSFEFHPSGGIVVLVQWYGEHTLIKFDDQGVEESRFDLTEPGYHQYRSALAVDRSGTIYISGHSTTWAYLLPGTELWAQDREPLFAGLWMETAPGGGVFVAGSIWEEEYQWWLSDITDYQVVQYGPDGTIRWLHRYSSEGLSEDLMAGMAIDRAGNVLTTGTTRSERHGSVITTVKYGSTPTAREPELPIPSDRIRFESYPNPFSTSTTIAFEVPRPGTIRLHVYDLLGRDVRSLVDGMLPAGRHEYSFGEQGLPAGLYVVRLLAGEESMAKTIVRVPH